MIHNTYHYIEHGIYFHDKLIWRHKCLYYFLHAWLKFNRCDLSGNKMYLLFWDGGSTVRNLGSCPKVKYELLPPFFLMTWI